MKKLVIIFVILVSIISLALLEPNKSSEPTPTVEMAIPSFEEEGYINDIPFNTEDVVKTNSITFEEEEYIDDIPFDTKEIVKNI